MSADDRDDPGAPGPGVGEYVARFDSLARSGAPGIRSFAAWLADQPEELAFHTVRSLAQAAGTDPNIVVRTAKAAGFSSFSAARKAVQQALRDADQGYVSRADALQQFGQGTLPRALSEAAQSNLRKAFSPSMIASIEEIVPQLISARRVYCVGVRMAFSLAHYFCYRGGIAHENVLPAPGQPGVILDSLVDCGPEDVVIVISFAHYSSEVLRAAAAARARNARVVAITDRRDSPLAEGAWRVLRAPVEGPHVMYSIAGAMMILENLLELMAASDPRARARIEAFERGLLEVGAYTRLYR